MLLRRVTVALVCAATVGLPLVTMSSAVQAAGETCQGRPATIVGPTGNGPLGPFGQMYGTPGNDVIVTNGAYAVDAGAGNDLICTTNSGKEVYLLPGTGVDVVDTTDINPSTVSFTNLGSPSDSAQDTFVGGVGQDLVYLSDTSGLDAIETGPGEDFLVVSCATWTAGNFRANLGPGDDGFGVDIPDLPYLLDHMGPIITNSCPATPAQPDGESFTVDGGPGLNRLSVPQAAQQRFIGIDLSKHVVTSNHIKVGNLIGFSDVWAESIKLRIVGDNSGNHITWTGCRGTARGVDGRDTILHVPFDDHQCKGKQSGPFRAFGGSGNDELHGDPSDEIFDGGPGHDRARAGKGHDVCRYTEVESGCEDTR